VLLRNVVPEIDGRGGSPDCEAVPHRLKWDRAARRAPLNTTEDPCKTS
jgi:hypothetical protein